MHVTALYKRVGDSWIGCIEEFPGANTQGRTKEELLENLKDAAGMVLEYNKRLTGPEYSDANREGLSLAQ